MFKTRRFKSILYFLKLRVKSNQTSKLKLREHKTRGHRILITILSLHICRLLLYSHGMDGLSPITADIGCKPVQEMVKDGDEMPDEYVCKDFHYGTIDDDVPVIDIPVVDLKVLTSSSACGREELGKLRSALSSSGYFQV
ncbi:uncharacterized protein LOC124885292 [Capsicum annuum]|uniref:uncharacterized protein LOC124885292 n=1 Tax=Capsicum annuum TaxID=4072 RepID=UPI001FB0D08B|nr:uncharacterized protein LOC124885292 [Capsicum annuum]